MTSLALAKARKTYYENNKEKILEYHRNRNANLSPEKRAEEREKLRLRKIERKKQIEEFLT
jgi:hypothetical protein